MPDSYIEGQCTDRYGIPLNVECNLLILDDANHSILAYGSAASGTGLFSVTVSGVDVGTTVLVTYGYPGTYQDLEYLAGAEYMTTVSGTTTSG